MKKIVLGFIIILFAGSSLFSQDLKAVRDDFSSFLEALGKEIIPNLQQNNLAGSGIGEAEFTDSVFYIAFSGGAVLSDGIGKFIDADNSCFNLLDVSGLINNFIPDDATDLYDKTKEFFPYPHGRLSVGFKSFLGIETIINFSIWPQALTDFGAGFAGLEGASLSNFNIGIQMRKALLHDKGPFPAVSIGAGYTYASFMAVYALPDTFNQEISGQELSLTGDLSLETSLHSAGIDLMVSKKLLFFIPFIKIRSQYQLADYTGKIAGYTAKLGELKTDDIEPAAELSISDLSLILGTGFELRMGKFGIVPSGTYSLSSGQFAADLAIKFQF